MPNERKCCICKKMFTAEDPAVLTMSAYGNARYLCGECESLLDTATLGSDYDTIKEAIGKIGKTVADTDNGDETVIDSVSEILTSAIERAELIREGTYDFSNDAPTEVAFEEIPDELLETEEDRERDARDKKNNAILDKITSWVCGAVLLGAIVYFLITLIF